MTAEEIQGLIQEFESNVRFDLRDFGTVVSQSEAAKALCTQARDAFPIVVEYLAAMPVAANGLNERVENGFMCLLDDLAKILELDVPSEIWAKSKNDWIEWARAQTMPT